MRMKLSSVEVQKAEAPAARVLPRNIKKSSQPAPTTQTMPQPQVAAESIVESSSLSTMAQADLKEIYKAELRSHIEANKFYPPISRKMGQTGTVVIAFTLLSDGTIINAKIETPSEFDQLNKAGLEAVKKIKRFKEIPSELGMNEMEVTVPLKFVTI